MSSEQRHHELGDTLVQFRGEEFEDRYLAGRECRMNCIMGVLNPVFLELDPYYSTTKSKALQTLLLTVNLAFFLKCVSHIPHLYEYEIMKHFKQHLHYYLQCVTQKW